MTSLREIAGPWDIVRFDGHTPTRLHGGLRRAYVDIGANGLSYTIECNDSGNRASIDRQGVLHADPHFDRFSTLMLCEPATDRRERLFYGFFYSQPKVEWMNRGRLRLWNDRTELILERPEQRRLAYLMSKRDLSGRWVPQMASRVYPGNGHEGWGFVGPSVLRISGNRIRYDGCGGAEFTFRYTPDGRMTDMIEHGHANCGSNTPGAVLLRMLRAGPLVERSAGATMALTADEYVVALQNEAEHRRGLRNPPPPASAGDTPPAPPVPQLAPAPRS